MSLKAKATEGVLERLQGRRATRVQALIGGLAAGAAVYKFLRSGEDDNQERGEPGPPDSAA